MLYNKRKKMGQLKFIIVHIKGLGLTYVQINFSLQKNLFIEKFV